MGSQGQVSQRRVSGWAMGLPPMGPGGVLWLGPYGWALQLFSVHCRAASGQGEGEGRRKRQRCQECLSKRTEERERKLGRGVKNSLQGRPGTLDSCGWCRMLCIELGTLLCPFLGNVLKLSPRETLTLSPLGWRGLVSVVLLQWDLQSTIGVKEPE